MKIERDENHHVIIKSDDGGSISSQSVEANLLFAILEELKELGGHLFAIELNTDKIE